MLYLSTISLPFLLTTWSTLIHWSLWSLSPFPFSWALSLKTSLSFHVLHLFNKDCSLRTVRRLVIVPYFPYWNKLEVILSVFNKGELLLELRCFSKSSCSVRCYLDISAWREWFVHPHTSSTHLHSIIVCREGLLLLEFLIWLNFSFDFPGELPFEIEEYASE